MLMRARTPSASHAGTMAGWECDQAVHAAKLVTTLETATRSALYRHTVDAEALADWLLATPEDAHKVFERVPLLAKKDLAALGDQAFTRPLAEFVHYYESSGTTGNPVAAPKALDDLLINTVNIGELWAQILQPGDIALILINAPFAPAACSPG